MLKAGISQKQINPPVNHQYTHLQIHTNTQTPTHTHCHEMLGLTECASDKKDGYKLETDVQSKLKINIKESNS